MNKTLALAATLLSLAFPAAAHGGASDRVDACDDGRWARTTNGYRDPDVRFARDMADGRGPRGQAGAAGAFVDVEADIRQGVQAGRLTRREADMLRVQAREVDMIKRRAWRNGRISHGEAHQIASAEDSLVNNLVRQLRDDDRRFDGRDDDRGHGHHTDGDDGRERRHDDHRDDRGDRDDRDDHVRQNGDNHDQRRPSTVASRL